MLGLIVVMLALALVACGGGDEEEEENGGEQEGTPAATKTVEAEETGEVAETPKPEKTEEPSGGGGGASLGDVPVYPGADKTGEYSGDSPIPLLGEGLDTEDYKDAQWAVYETGDSVDDVANFYKDKMPDNGWDEESWFDTSVGDGAAWGGYTRNDGDTAAWVFIGAGDGQTQIVIGVGSR